METYTHSTQKAEKEDCCEFQVSLDYIMSSRPIWVTQQKFISKIQKENSLPNSLSLKGQCLPKKRQAMWKGGGGVCLTFHCYHTGTVCWSTWAYKVFYLSAEQSGSHLDMRRWTLSLQLWWGTDENSHHCCYHRDCSLWKARNFEVTYTELDMEFITF